MAARGTRGDKRLSQVAKESPRFKSELKALGARVRELRQARDWTLERAAEAMNLDLKHLQKVEAAMVNVTFVTLVRIAEGLDEPMVSLFQRATSRPAKKP